MEFNRIIKLLRTERGITQKQAAEDLHISQALLSHYEKGIRECGLDFVVAWPIITACPATICWAGVRTGPAPS